MIFILNEEIKNGTVLLSIENSGVEANNFSEAIEKVKTLKSFKDDRTKIITENDEEFNFSVIQESENFSVTGSIKNKELTFIK